MRAKAGDAREITSAEDQTREDGALSCTPLPGFSRGRGSPKSTFRPDGVRPGALSHWSAHHFFRQPVST